MKNVLYLFVFPSLLLCNLLPTNSLSWEVNKVSFKNASQITYLFFKVEKNGTGPDKIILQGKKQAPGKLKFQPAFDRNSGNVGDYIVSLTDVGGKEIVKQLVENPLNPEMESFDNGIGRNKVSLQNAEFSIRYPHSDEIRVVKIEKITKEGSEQLFIQKL
ncbi:hypothetical protein HNP38_002979 [Chryseobacterium defluvii]|uniref:Uncharacterized protein n=1 Tax=Chryseobacterium defluvii TaxID=160396 RepID=A0A840KJI7_9FLAO|nr:hypothetical protein [Chryseobacterium defluvii]MBB4807673.1 hypothetical protein [Chryseobacterium defluvii]